MSDYISRSEFFMLYQLLKDKLVKKYPDHVFPKQDTAIIGYGKFKEVKNAIYIRNLFTNKASAGYLYNLLLKFQNEEISFATITDIPINAILKAVGLDNMTAFRSKCKEQVESVTYHCLYYSFINAKIKDCSLKLVRFEDGRITATVIDFHENKDAAELTGDAKLVDKALVIHLEKGKHYLHFILQTHGEMGGHPGITLPTSKVLQGMITGISKDGYLINLECVLLREGLYEKEEERNNAARYLTLKRRHHRVKSKETNQDTTKNLLINRINIDGIANMAGRTYRIWNYSFKRKEIWQAKFSIGHDYSASIETPEDDSPKNEPFTCHMNINQHFQLEVAAFRGNSLSLFAILVIPPKTRSIVQGVFCTIGNDHKLGTNYFVMRADTTDFSAKKFELPAFETFIKNAKNKSELLELRDELDRVPGIIIPEDKTKKNERLGSKKAKPEKPGPAKNNKTSKAKPSPKKGAR